MKQLRLAFLWDGVTEHYGKRFKDGLWAALKHLEKKHTIGYFEPTADEAIAQFKPDVLLFWGALCEHVKPHVAQLPYKKAIAFAGGPITANTVDGFDLYFTESKINEDEFASFGKPFLRAFGVNEQLYKPHVLQKKYDAAFAGTFALWKRHNLFAESVGEKGIAVGLFQDHEKQCYEWCQQAGVETLDERPREEVVLILNQSHTVLNCASFWGGGQRLTLEAMACNVPPIVMSDSPKNIEYVKEAGFGTIVEPEVGHIRRAVEFYKDWNPGNTGRDYILEKYTSKHYADALERGLTQL